MGVFQGRQARSGRRQPAQGRRSAQEQRRHPGALRRSPVQARSLQRRDRRVDARARRRRLGHRSRRRRQEDPGGETEAQSKVIRRAFIVAVATACFTSCAPALLKLPAGPGGPAADARDALIEATTACQKITTLSAEIAASGSAGGRGLRARLLTGGAIAPDVEGARQLGDDWRVISDGPTHIYLRRDPHAAPWRLVATVHPSTAGRAEWRAEYRDFQDGVPRTIHLAALDRQQFD